VRFNIMIIGSSGSGKSSFLKSFFKLEDTKDQPLEKTLKITALPPKNIMTDNWNAIFHLWDTRGYGDQVLISDSMAPIMDHLENNFSTPDVIHCVWFLITPGRLHPFEITLMKELNRITVVIPLIGKADSMDPIQKKQFQKKML